MSEVLQPHLGQIVTFDEWPGEMQDTGVPQGTVVEFDGDLVRVYTSMGIVEFEYEGSSWSLCGRFKRDSWCQLPPHPVPEDCKVCHRPKARDFSAWLDDGAATAPPQQQPSCVAHAPPLMVDLARIVKQDCADAERRWLLSEVERLKTELQDTRQKLSNKPEFEI